MKAQEFLQATWLQAELCLSSDEPCGECHICIFRDATEK